MLELEKVLNVINKYNNEEAIQNILNGCNLITSSLNQYKHLIANILNEQNQSDEIFDENSLDIRSDLNTIKLLKNEFQTFINHFNTQNEQQVEDKSHSTHHDQKRFSVFVTTNKDSCPECQKNDEVISLKPSFIKYNLYNEDGTYKSRTSLNTLICSKCKKQYISREQYLPLRDLNIKSDTNLDISFSKCAPEFIGFYDFVVISHSRICVVNNHYLETINAEIEIVKEDGTLYNQILPAHYCLICDRFVILKNDYKLLQGVPTCQVIDETKTVSSKSEWGSGAEESSSILTKRGYNVNCIEKLTEAQRHTILKGIILHGEMSKQSIISQIDINIQRGSKIASWSTAVQKWTEDRDFVSSLDELDAEIETVGVRSLTIK